MFLFYILFTIIKKEFFHIRLNEYFKMGLIGYLHKLNFQLQHINNDKTLLKLINY